MIDKAIKNSVPVFSPQHRTKEGKEGETVRRTRQAALRWKTSTSTGIDISFTYFGDVGNDFIGGGFQ